MATTDLPTTGGNDVPELLHALLAIVEQSQPPADFHGIWWPWAYQYALCSALASWGKAVRAGQVGERRQE